MPPIRSGKNLSLPKLEPASPATHPSPSSSKLVASPNTRSPSVGPTLFPIPNDATPPPPKRPSHHKKRPPSHVPRPPNAFILFRANFIRNRHLHSTSAGPLSNVSPTALSTIVGITWRNLPEEERQIWVEKARKEREEHKLRHPSYRYQPLPTAEERALNRESKRRVKDENISRPDMERCKEISRLLVEGHRGKDLEDRVALFDQTRPFPSSDNASHLARSASLPNPPRHRNVRRPRARSTSDSPPAAPEGEYQTYDMAHNHDYDSPFVSSPEPSSAITMSLLDVPEHTMPELTYDAPSPSSINLPEPHEGMLATHPSLNNMTTTYSHSPELHRQPHSLQTAYAASSSVSDPFRTPFSTFVPWDQTQAAVEGYYQFPPHLPVGSVEDSSLTRGAHLPQMTTLPTNTTHPYASPIPPFELYHTLKSFEQSFPPVYGSSKKYGYSQHDLSHELRYDHTGFRVLSVDQ